MGEGNNRQIQDIGDRTVKEGIVGFSTYYTIPVRNSGEPAWNMMDEET